MKTSTLLACALGLISSGCLRLNYDRCGQNPNFHPECPEFRGDAGSDAQQLPPESADAGSDRVADSAQPAMYDAARGETDDAGFVDAALGEAGDAAVNNASSVDAAAADVNG